MATSKECQYPLERTRNTRVMAHIDTGKTTLTERVLYYTGANYKIDEAYEGTSTMDYMEREGERGTTVTFAAMTCHWILQERNQVEPGAKEYRINIIDTPGHADFTIEVERSFRVLDSAVGVFDAKDGVEPQSENIWRQADTYHVPRITFTSKMDIMSANFFMTVDQIEHRLGKDPVYIQLSIGKKNDFRGIVDLVEMQTYIYNGNKGDDISITGTPEELEDEVNEWHQKMAEQICDPDGELTGRYLEDEGSSIDELKRKLRKSTCENNAVPVCCGFVYFNKDIQKLLNAVIECMPSPLDVPAIRGWTLDGEEDERGASDEEPFFAPAFKVISNPFVGRLVFFRVYSGMLNTDSYVFNSSGEKKRRVGHILQMYTDRRMKLEKVFFGDIAAAVSFKVTSTGDMVCDEQCPIVFESLEIPKPVIDVAIEPKIKTGQAKMTGALQKLAEENPTSHMTTNVETGQTIISSMGELHLKIVVNRLLREYNVGANVGALQVACREIFTKPVDIEPKYVKQSGGKGQYGHCRVKFEPMSVNAEKTYELVNAVTGGVTPKEFIALINEGTQRTAKSGILGGYPALGAKAIVYDGPYHEVDSSKMAFHVAGSLAFEDAMQKGGAALLEPVMKVEVTISEDYMGFVAGDINSRRGRAEGFEDISGSKMIRAFVPPSETPGYSTDLRSGTQGRGNHSMFFEKYEPIPRNIVDKILSDKK